jgi:ketosteroid isomerase-like protein
MKRLLMVKGRAFGAEVALRAKPRVPAAVAGFGVVMVLATLGNGLAADLKSLVQAELSFSRLSEIQGIRTAFLACFADDAVVFRPRPVPGRKFYLDRAFIAGHLSWKPVFADIAASGDLGYTTGPYEFRKEKASDPIAGRGHFVSVWRVQKDGTWKVVFDGGIDYPDPFTVEPALDPDLIPAGLAPASATTGPSADPKKAKAELIALERTLADGVAKSGIRALAEAMSADVRINISGMAPLLGKRTGLEALSKKPGSLRFAPESVFVSNAGDMGYVIGVSEYTAGTAGGRVLETNSFVHIWKKSASGRWEIVLAVASLVS